MDQPWALHPGLAHDRHTRPEPSTGGRWCHPEGRAAGAHLTQEAPSPLCTWPLCFREDSPISCYLRMGLAGLTGRMAGAAQRAQTVVWGIRREPTFPWVPGPQPPEFSQRQLLGVKGSMGSPLFAVHLCLRVPSQAQRGQQLWESCQLRPGQATSSQDLQNPGADPTVTHVRPQSWAPSLCPRGSRARTLLHAPDRATCIVHFLQRS